MAYLMLWSLGALVLFMVALGALRIFFRTVRETPVDSRSFDFALEDLEKLVASGKMTPEEYQRARAVVLSRSDATFLPAKGFPVLGPADVKTISSAAEDTGDTEKE
jgi:hypothetical protein